VAIEDLAELNAVLGAASGDGAPVQKSNTEHFINKRSDFPNLVGSVSTFEPSVSYHIRNGLSEDVEIITSEGTNIKSDGVFGTGYNYTGANVAITSNNVGFSIDNLAITAPNAAQVLSCTGSALNTCFADRFRIYNSTTLGAFDGMAQVMNNVVFNGFDQGFSYTGAPIIGHSIVNCFMQDNPGAAATFFNWADAVFLQLAMRGIEMNGVDAGSIYFASSVNGANLVAGTDGVVADCTFGLSGLGTALSGFSDNFQTVGWEFSANSPAALVEESREAIQYGLFVDNNVDITNQGEFYEIGVPDNGAFSTNGAPSRWTLNADGSATYNGNKPVLSTLMSTASVEKVGGGTDKIEQRIGVNWVAAALGEPFSQSTTKNSQETVVISGTEVLINPGDNVRPIYANVEGTDNITIHAVNVIINSSG
jgi:hypothetical protein